MYVAARLNGIRAREEHEAKLASDEAAGIGSRGIMLGGFDVTVEGVAISGPLETPGEIHAATEHDWRSADIGGESLRNPRLTSVGCLVYTGRYPIVLIVLNRSFPSISPRVSSCRYTNMRFLDVGR